MLRPDPKQRQPIVPGKSRHQPPRRAPLDAIVVPTGRPSKHLDYVIKLAQGTAGWLLVLCSHEASACSVLARAAAAGTRTVAVTIPQGYRHKWLSFRSDAFPQAAFGREATDIHIKRNIALLLSRLLGWEYILFLDDDVRGLTAQSIANLTAALTSHSAAGLLVDSFPDNSVVMHAERLSGIEPGVSLCGGSLAVNTGLARGFFPDIYNEDWFFLFAASRSAPVTSVGSVGQLACDPFAQPMRAASEEFGDVVAEGVKQLLAAGVSCERSSLSDWSGILERRRELIATIRGRLATGTTTAQTVAADRALRAAEARLARITARQCLDYVTLWQEDLAAWHDQLQQLPTALGLTDALDLLEVGEPTIEQAA